MIKERISNLYWKLKKKCSFFLYLIILFPKLTDKLFDSNEGFRYQCKRMDYKEEFKPIFKTSDY